MANFLTCSTNPIGILTLLAALFSKKEDGFTGFRIILVSPQSVTGPITCSNQDDFVQLLNQSIELAQDDLPALRVVISESEDGAGLSAHDCAGTLSGVEMLAKQAFVLTDSGDVAVNLISIVEPAPEPPPEG